MAASFKQLIYFSEEQLLFSEEETRAILTFFFRSEHRLISELPISIELSRLAQGLLVEAIDASYALGWIEQAFRWLAKPGPSVRKALQKLALRGARHWFKHLQKKPLSEVEVYEIVRNQLESNFRKPFRIIVEAKDKSSAPVRIGAFVDYSISKNHA